MTTEYASVLTHTLDHGLTEAIDALAPGEVLLTRPAKSTLEYIGTAATIMSNEAYHEGRRNAVSGIWFGDMTLRSDAGHKHTHPMAIKPLGRAWKVSEELRLANSLKTLSARHRPHVSGTPFTYVPLGAP